MNSEQIQIRNRNTELIINYTEDICNKDIMKEHPMICTKLKHIRSQVEKYQRQERYSAEERYPMALYPKKPKKGIRHIK